MPCCCESGPGLTSACSPPSPTLACAPLLLSPCWSLNFTLAVMSVFFISGEGKLGGGREYCVQDVVITTSLVITRSVWGSGTIVNPRSSSGVILSVEGSSLVLVLEELVRDPFDISASLVFVLEELVRDSFEIITGVEDSLLVHKFVVIGSWFIRSDP